MQSDVLPYTMYDSMNYSSVNEIGPPSGFERRDAPQLQVRRQEPPIQSPMQSQQQQQLPQQLQQQAPPPMYNQYSSQEAPKQTNNDILRQIALNEESIDLGEEPVKPKGADIGNYKNIKDILYIVLAVLFVDVLVICMVRFLPEVFGQSLNRWYDLFGLSAVLADVLIIVIGFVIARYVYTLYVKPKYGEGKWSPFMFTGVVVGTQLLHDLAFYYGIIQQVPRGQNMMIDVFKDYAAAGGAKILFGDAIMMVLSSVIAMSLKSQPMHIVSSFGLVVSYVLPYILYTKNQFSVLK